MNDHSQMPISDIEKTVERPVRPPLRAPVMVNLELTSGCNLQCRHCYNFWREDPASMKDSIDRQKIDRVIEKIVDAEIFHVVLTGGEPFLNFDILEYGT